MRYVRFAAVAALSLLAACADRYGAFNPAQQGKSEQHLTPARWSVTMTGSSIEFARQAALYRGAVLLAAGGYSQVQIVSLQSEGINWHRSYNGFPLGTKHIRTITAQFVGAQDATPPAQCESSVRNTKYCQTLPVAEVLATVGPALGRTAAQTDAEIAAAKKSPRPPLYPDRSPSPRSGSAGAHHLGQPIP